MIIKASRYFTITLLFALCALPLPSFAAQDLTVTPVVIDERGKARDIINETISITNTSGHKLTLYPSVNDVRHADGAQAFEQASTADEASRSLSNWIELSRGVIELGPGEEKTVQFVIRISPSAVV